MGEQEKAKHWAAVNGLGWTGAIQNYRRGAMSMLGQGIVGNTDEISAYATYTSAADIRH